MLGVVVSLERDHKGGVEGVDAVEQRKDVLVDFGREEACGLVGRDVVDIFDVFLLKQFLAKAECLLFCGFGVEVHLVGDTLLHFVCGLIGMVFHEHEKTENKEY